MWLLVSKMIYKTQRQFKNDLEIILKWFINANFIKRWLKIHHMLIQQVYTYKYNFQSKTWDDQPYLIANYQHWWISLQNSSNFKKVKKSEKIWDYHVIKMYWENGKLLWEEKRRRKWPDPGRLLRRWGQKIENFDAHYSNSL